MERLGTETAFEVLARARQLEREGRSVIHLEIGEPDFPTPAAVVEAGVAALREGFTHYGPAAGLPELREAVAAHVATTRGVPVDAAEVVITPGGKPVLFFAALALVQRGDEVIHPDPGFPIYESVAAFCGARPVALPLREADGFGLDVDRLAASLNERTRLVILNSPHNPTGSTLDRAQVDRMVEVLARWPKAWILSDEIYSRILYDGEHVSIFSRPELRERVILLDGFSKSHAMTGWRLGYGVMPTPLAERMARLQTNCTSCTATFVQRAGLAALAGPQDDVDAMVAEFRRRRDRIVGRLRELPGVRCGLPAGAFYVLANVAGTGFSGAELARRLLEEAGVACLSGSAFGRTAADALRFSYANSLAAIDEAMDRVAAFLAGA